MDIGALKGFKGKGTKGKGSWDSVNCWDHPCDWFQVSQTFFAVGCDSAAPPSAGPSPAKDSQQGTIGAVTQAPPGLSPNIGSAAIRPKTKPKASSCLIAGSCLSASCHGSSSHKGRCSGCIAWKLDWIACHEPTPAKDSFHSVTTLKDCGLDVNS